MSIVLGIDGGGTKTTGVIANSSGEVLAAATVGPTNPNSVSKDRVHLAFTSLFNKLRKIDALAYNHIQHIFAGVAGASHERTQKELMKKICATFNRTINVTVSHDALPALYSGTLGNAGIVQIAGTGAVTFGISSTGKEARVGGWGHLFSDHGSGYAIGRDALEKVFLAYDGLIEQSSLTKKVLNYFQIDAVPDLVRLIYHSGKEKTLIASLSEVVMEAYEQGDPIAHKILSKNANYLGKAIAALLGKLFTKKAKSGKISVIVVGGLFNRLDLLEDLLMAGLGEERYRVQLKIPQLPAVGGSVVGALKQEQINICEDFVKQFKKSHQNE